MPDHLAELIGPGAPGKTHVIVAERVEGDLPAARARAMAYYRAGLLTAAGASVVDDAPASGFAGPAHRVAIRLGPAGDERIDSMLVLLLGGKVVEVVARHGEEDADAARDVVAIARSLTCR